MFRHHWSTKLASSCQLTLSRCWSSFYTSKKTSTLQRWTEIPYRYAYIYICIFISQLGIYILIVVHIGTIHMIKWSTGGAALPAAAQEALPPGSWRTVHYGKSGQSLSNIHIYHIYPYIYPYPNIYQYLSTYTYTHPTYYVIYTHLFSFWKPPINSIVLEPKAPSWLPPSSLWPPPLSPSPQQRYQSFYRWFFRSNTSMK